MSTTLLILKIYVTFKDVQMMIKHFFDISTGFIYKKMEKSSPSIYRDVHGLRNWIKICSPKKKDIFWRRKLTLKTQNSPIWVTWRYVNSQNPAVSFNAVQSFWYSQTNFVPAIEKLHDSTDINCSMYFNRTPPPFILCQNLLRFLQKCTWIFFSINFF